MMLEELEGIEKNASAFRVASRIPLEDIFKKAGESVALIDPFAIISELHLAVACANAVADFKDKQNIAKSVGIEMLLYLAFTYQIADAIRIAGAKRSANFVAFCITKQACRKFLSIKGIEVKRYKQTAQEKRKALSIYNGTSSELEIMKRMAQLKLSRN